MENPEVLGKAGKKVVILGNEAIARGALEAGLGFSACYPGTPSSEIGITLADIAKNTRKFYYEWSSNEKVAFEACAGAAFSGVRSLTAVKHFGFNVASDSVFPVVYTGVKAGMVFVVADDPQGHSSAQSEQDSRFYSRMGMIPTLEPSNTQECKDLTKKAFEISERFELPVILRTTTMVNHSTGSVKLGAIPKPKTKGRFVKDFERYHSIKPILQKMHCVVLGKIQKMEKQYAGLNCIEGTGKTGIITSGVSYQYIRELGLKNIRLAKLTMTYPISRSFVSRFLKGLKTVIVVEELEPIVEDFVRMVAKDVNPGVRIYGKDILPRVGEFNCDIIMNAIAPVLGLRKPDFSAQDKWLKAIKIPVRKPVLCPGCPHRSTFYAVKKVLGAKPVFAGDIGCYVLGMFKPFEMQDFFLSMGASMGVTHGIEKVSNQRTVIFIGDSTFFHAGMPGLANLVYNDPKPLIVVMDNRITAMTGHQPHPGTGITAMGEKCKPIDIEAVVRSFGIKNVRTVNTYNQKELQATIKEFAGKDEIGVIISRGMCRLLYRKLMKSQGRKLPKFRINPAMSVRCAQHAKEIACPAIQREGSRVSIKEDMCWGCGLCAQIFPKGAVQPVAVGQASAKKGGKK